MLVNYDMGFLFVHIQKTAGTSMHKVLSAQHGSKQLYNNHTLIQHVSLTDQQKSLFKFAFVRNPWDRLYSWYNMSIQKGPINKFHAYTLKNSQSFSEFLDCLEVIEDDLDAVDRSLPYYKSISFNQLDYISDQAGLLSVDFIGRFESLEADFEIVSQRLGLGGVKLPHVNKFSHGNYRSYYTDNDIQKVQRLYRRDIEYFAYRF